MIESAMQIAITPIHTDIVLIDIIDYSKLSNLEQYNVVDTMSRFFKKAINLMLKKSNITQNQAILGFIATGDGFFIILSPKLKGYGVVLGLSLNNISKNIKKKLAYFKGIKVAVHTGDVIPFLDILGHKNFIGNGLNDCARYLEYKSPYIKDYFTDGYVLVSKESTDEFNKFLRKNRKLYQIIEKLGFNISSEIVFEDKHKISHYGYFIWTDIEVVITPP
jgi:hypothetical protein